MSAKLGFAAGLFVGVLAGSRAGRGLYDRSAATASAVVHDPRVRSGASAALRRAGSAGSSVAGAAARKVRDRGKTEDGEGDGRGEQDGGRGELKGRKRRLIGGVRNHGVGVKLNGHRVGRRPNLHLHRSGHVNHAGRSGQSDQAGRSGVSAPSVQARPKEGNGDGRGDQARAGEG